MQNTLILILCITLLACQKSPNKEEWIDLFNGKNLDGWDLKIAGEDLNKNYKNTIKIDSQMIRVNYDEYTQFDNKYGHLFYNKPYSHYILDYSYRFLGNQTPGGEAWNVRNSGVMFHSQSAKSMSYQQGFPVSLEMQLLGGLDEGKTRHTGNLCTPGTYIYMDDSLRMEHCIDSKSKTYFGNQWVKARLIVLGDSVAHQIIEGDTVLSFNKLTVGWGFVNEGLTWESGGFSPKDQAYWEKRQDTPLCSGYIAIQAESHPIDFKDIRLLNLKGCMNKEAKNYKTYFKEHDEASCQY